MVRRRLTALLVMVVVMSAMAVPAFAANNAGKSLDHRNEKSLQGTYGTRHLRLMSFGWFRQRE